VTPPLGRGLLVAGGLALALAAGLLLLRSPAPRAPSAPREKPNVIVYLVDTLRADHLGLYGYERDTSPVLDRWAADAVVFDRAYAPSSWTKPSTVSLLSGLGPLRHRVEDRLDVIPSEVVLLSERLAEAGWTTEAVVTNPNVLPLWGFDRGFGAFEDIDSRGLRTRADHVLDHVIDRIGALGDEPFFFYVHLFDPHTPYEPPPPWDEKFPPRSDDPIERDVSAYDAEIAFGDDQLQRLLDALKKQGIYDDTVLVFVSDHGEEMQEHGRKGHGKSLFQEVVRVPLLIKLPGGAHAGERVAARVTLTDVVPTLLDVLGEPVPAGLDGRSLMGLLGEAPDAALAERPVFLSLDLAWTSDRTELVRGVVSGSDKYLRRIRPEPEELLFDLGRDPGETDDLAARAGDRVARLSEALDAELARRSTGVHFRVWNDLGEKPNRCRTLLRTDGRFVDVSPHLLESEDDLEVSEDATSLRLRCVLRNRPHPTGGTPPWVADEDGFVFSVEPLTASVTVETLALEPSGELALRVGPERALRPVPFAFETLEPALQVRDGEELLVEVGQPPVRAPMGAYLGVVMPKIDTADVPDEVIERLRAFGYIVDDEGAAPDAVSP
jgi:arylsulfatase A-like enzyme